MVQAHGGDIWAQSEESKDFTFSFSKEKSLEFIKLRRNNEN
jgi:signal transduction histidine kinase